jgi:predicted Zn-dependent protease
MAMSTTQEKALAQLSLQQILGEFQNGILPPNHPAVQYVERITKRILNVIDPSLTGSDTRWRVFVIESPIANAFVLPGGEIFVFTGLLPIANGEAGLAAIIGHEIAHKLVRHSAEKMSFYQFFSVAASILQIFVMGGEQVPFAGLLQQLFLFLPFSRRMEVEADYIGLLLMARACYDPKEAIGVWQRMEASEGKNPPAFMSTHPSHHERIKKIKGWMPAALAEYEAAGCYDRISSRLFQR